ncbi:kunitz-type protease inhibitor 2 [Chanos chanos]|uniref:Kunitz-type protease inhibitor 2 n=1 Tax=Chanos chanos TaxID=29144 RepID=A0A6J2VMI4_CHACN|nr:kunitz-type serine protease inhibitor 6-like [Chanos chanos]
MAQVRCVAVVVCLLSACLVHGQDTAECAWDSNVALEQGLNIKSFDDGASYAARYPEISDAQKCREACCQREDCQVALMGTPADALAECFLVNCVKDGKDVCLFQPDTQFKVYRKKQMSQSDSPRVAADVSAPNSTDHCHLPKEVGPCRGAFTRFFHNVTSQACEQFIFGGCRGNENNFMTQDECESSCKGVTGTVLESNSLPDTPQKRMSIPENDKAVSPEGPATPLPEMTSDEFAAKCQAPPLTGHCRAAHRRYYYNPATGTCEQFIYGGCRGNQNNYETAEECQTTCTVRVVPSSRKSTEDQETGDDQEACMAPSEPGPCRAYFKMFFYEPSSGSCQPFVYGGCRGNSNRYSTVEECMSRCAGVDGRFDEHGNGQGRGRWTPAFFLVATLAVISAVLLVGLILISVRRAKLHHFHILDDKQELLTEEQMLEETTPKQGSP